MARWIKIYFHSMGKALQRAERRTTRELSAASTEKDRPLDGGFLERQILLGEQSFHLRVQLSQLGERATFSLCSCRRSDFPRRPLLFVTFFWCERRRCSCFLFTGICVFLAAFFSWLDLLIFSGSVVLLPHRISNWECSCVLNRGWLEVFGCTSVSVRLKCGYDQKVCWRMLYSLHDCLICGNEKNRSKKAFTKGQRDWLRCKIWNISFGLVIRYYFNFGWTWVTHTDIECLDVFITF